MAPADLHPLHGLMSGMVVEPGIEATLERLPDVASVDTMLCGATASGRSSLALHFALHHAATTSRPVLFLCRQDGLEGSMPLLPHDCASDNPCLHLLQLKYIRSYVDVQRFGACMHLLQTPLAAVVVEDLGALLRIDDRNILVRTLAMLLEGIRSYRAASGCECPLLVTDSTGESRRPRYIFDRWFPLTLAITAAPRPSGAEGQSFVLSVGGPLASTTQASGAQSGLHEGNEVPGAVQPAGQSAGCTYRLVDDHFVLERVHEAGRGGAARQAVAQEGPHGAAAAPVQLFW